VSPSLLTSSGTDRQYRGVGMSEAPVVTTRLDSWKQVAAYIGRDVRTVIRWEKQRGLPVHRVPGGGRQVVFAYPHEIDEWLKYGHSNHHNSVEAGEPHLNGVTRTDPTPHSSATAAKRVSLIPGSSAFSPRFRLSKHQSVIWLTAGFGMLAIVAYAIHVFAFPPRVQLSSAVQLTKDGEPKNGLVTDGKTVYFGEHQGSRLVLASISVDGGPIRPIATSFVQAVPADISPDGKQLLVLAGEGIETERALWIVPVPGGQPRQVGEIRCHAAVWSPDGHRIAFAAQNAIFLTEDNGASIRKVQAFDSAPVYLRWAPDGQGLRIHLWDPEGSMSSFWDLTFSDQDKAQVSSLVPLLSSRSACWGKSITLDESGRSILAGGECTKEQIYLLEKNREPWSPHFDLVPTSILIQGPQDLALDPGSKRVFALGISVGLQGGPVSERSELLRFDVRSDEFKPFLPGINAADVDFSRDGKWIAYVRRSDQSLWISHEDGTAARQIEIHPNRCELPRWSPDGRKLAFMALLPGKPWRIFTASRDAGAPREASMGSDNQGAPTWSPDGKWIVYGNVECQETGTCAIHKFDLSKGQELTVPGSEGLGTARWSPDGRYIAALNPVKHAVMVFDQTTQQWRNLADGVNGNDLSWSADSQYLYASRPAGDHPDILRISLKDAKAETVVDLRSFTALSGQIDTWFALTPDSSIIFMRTISGNEIYSLAYSEK